MSRYRINERFPAVSAYARNDIYRQFTPVFNTIFSAESLAVEHKDGDAGYVTNTEVEDSLRSFIDTPVNHINLVVGETGIGKSTYLRKIFTADQNPTISNNKLFIPYFLNGKTVTTENYREVFIKQIRAAYNLCRKHFPKELGTFDFEEIHEFIDEHNSSLLEVGGFFEDLSAKEILGKLKKEDPYAFYAEMLKYVSDKTTIETVLVVVDDVEAIENSDAQSLFVHQTCRFHKCLKNVGERKFNGITIISLRPFTVELLKKTDWFKAYTSNNDLNIPKPATLAHIFLARFDYVLNKYHGSHYKDIERFEKAREILERIFYRFESDLLSYISTLCNYNIREAIKLTGKVISNRRFIQGNVRVREQFVIRNEQFIFNDGNIVKSIAFDQEDVFFDHRGTLFNILKNEAKPETDLIICYICKYFYTRSSRNWDNLEYIECHRFLKDIEILKIDKKYLDYCLNYLIDENVLEVETVLNGGKSSKYIYAKPKLFGVFKLLQHNSVLVDAFRDDTYCHSDSLEIDGDIQPILRIKGSSGKALGTLKFWESLIESEKSLIMRINPKYVPDFKRKFGDTLVCRKIGTGISKTLSSAAIHHKSEYTRVEEKLINVENLY